ncbi:hypothetical protein [Streptomyces sp. NPDC059166]|uniref:hypothetical protein n=1 Tax=Streptomyces sp. NPDC059166 TaxID=3346752 RepID=UPI003681FC27
METILLDRETPMPSLSAPPRAALFAAAPPQAAVARAGRPPAAPGPAARPTAEVPGWAPLLLAGDPDDDGSEPHICRGID